MFLPTEDVELKVAKIFYQQAAAVSFSVPEMLRLGVGPEYRSERQRRFSPGLDDNGPAYNG